MLGPLSRLPTGVLKKYSEAVIRSPEAKVPKPPANSLGRRSQCFFFIGLVPDASTLTMQDLLSVPAPAKIIGRLRVALSHRNRVRSMGDRKRAAAPPPPQPPPVRRAGSFPPLGEDINLWLSDHSLALRFGTSLRLMASCSAFLNASNEFNEVDPEGDWEKWSTRVGKANKYTQTAF